MLKLTIILLSALLLLCVIRNRRLQAKLAAVTARRRADSDALSRLLTLLHEELSPEMRTADVLVRVVDFCQHGLQATQALALIVNPDDRDSARIVAASPPLPEATTAAVQLGRESSSQFYWSRQAVRLERHSLPPWIPPAIAERTRSAMIAPLRTNTSEAFVLLTRDGTLAAYRDGDQTRFSIYTRLFELEFNLLRIDKHRAELAHDIQQAHEAGMLQVLTGIVHNLGNTLTVIQLALDQQRGGDLQDMRCLLELTTESIMPELLRQQRAGTLAAFLSRSEGSEFIGALEQSLGELRRLAGQHRDGVDYISRKFAELAGVIGLQQQFMGELGTENVVSIATVMRDVGRISAPSLTERGITLIEACETEIAVQVDGALLRHVLLVLIKHSVAALSASTRSALQLSLTVRSEDAGRVVAIEIRDNGTGADAEPGRVVSGGNLQRQQDLEYCRNWAGKYSGELQLRSEYGKGSTVTMRLPVYTDASLNGAATEEAKQEHADR